MARVANVIYDKVADQCKTYICPVCQSSSMEWHIVSTKVEEPEFRWYCGSCGNEPSYEPHLRLINEGDSDE